MEDCWLTLEQIFTQKKVLKRINLINYDISGSRHSHEEEDEVDEEDGDTSIPPDRQPPKSTLLSKINANTIKSILEVLCDESVSDQYSVPYQNGQVS